MKRRCDRCGREQKTDSSQRVCGSPATRIPVAHKAHQLRHTSLVVISVLTLLFGHGIKSSHFLLNILAAALGAFRVYFVFLECENQFEGFVTIVANVVVYGHGGLPLDCDHELLLEL